MLRVEERLITCNYLSFNELIFLESEGDLPFYHCTLGRKVVQYWKWKPFSCVQLFVIPWIYSPWHSPGQNTGVGSRSFLQGIFPTQGSNPGLLHCRQVLYQLSYQGSPTLSPDIKHFLNSILKILDLLTQENLVSIIRKAYYVLGQEELCLFGGKITLPLKAIPTPPPH